MNIVSSSVPHFDGSKVEVSALLKKQISDVSVFEKLFECGMTVRSGDFYIAKEMQQKRTLDPAVYRLIMSRKDSAPQVRASERNVSLKFNDLWCVRYYVKTNCAKMC